MLTQSWAKANSKANRESSKKLMLKVYLGKTQATK
jgi:hypothetical protein